MKRVNVRSYVVASLAAAGLLSCGPELAQPWQLTDFRVLGVRVESAGDPLRSTPRRGESAQLELFTADPMTRGVRVAWIILAAQFSSSETPDAGTGALSLTNLPRIEICDTPDFRFPPIPGIQVVCGPRAQMTVPEMGGVPDGRGRETLTVLGIACAGGRIMLGSSAGNVPFTCEGSGAKGWPFTYSLYVGGEGRDNRRPRIREVHFGAIAGERPAITTESAGSAPICADHTRATTCTKLRFETFYEDGDREMYGELDPMTGMIVQRQERLVTGYIVTGGRLDGAFRTDNSEEPITPMANDWLPAKEAGMVRVIVYSTDSRGGFDYREAAVVVR